MVVTSSSSSSSCGSFGSFDDVAVKPPVVKFLCSYGGKILPRHPDGMLRYLGGDTRVLAVNRSISFSELQAKMRELCGWASASLRCQLPNEDLDALISVTSNEDLANLLEEYELAGLDRLKIRAFLFPPKTQNPNPTVNAGSSSDRCVLQMAAPPTRHAGDPRLRHHACPRPHRFLVHHGNHWQ